MTGSSWCLYCGPLYNLEVSFPYIVLSTTWVSLLKRVSPSTGTSVSPWFFRWETGKHPQSHTCISYPCYQLPLPIFLARLFFDSSLRSYSFVWKNAILMVCMLAVNDYSWWLNQPLWNSWASKLGSWQRCLEKQIYSPKWWWMIVISHDRIRKESPKKQIQVSPPDIWKTRVYTSTNDNGKPTIWRCISYIRWFSIAMLVFGGDGPNGWQYVQ